MTFCMIQHSNSCAKTLVRANKFGTSVCPVGASRSYKGWIRALGPKPSQKAMVPWDWESIGNEILHRTVYLCKLLKENGIFFPQLKTLRVLMLGIWQQWEDLLDSDNCSKVDLDQCEYGLYIPDELGELGHSQEKHLLWGKPAGVVSHEPQMSEAAQTRSGDWLSSHSKRLGETLDPGRSLSCRPLQEVPRYLPEAFQWLSMTTRSGFLGLCTHIHSKILHACSFLSNADLSHGKHSSQTEQIQLSLSGALGGRVESPGEIFDSRRIKLEELPEGNTQWDRWVFREIRDSLSQQEQERKSTSQSKTCCAASADHQTWLEAQHQALLGHFEVMGRKSTQSVAQTIAIEIYWLAWFAKPEWKLFSVLISPKLPRNGGHSAFWSA